MLKVKPHPAYPPEEGRYFRGQLLYDPGAFPEPPLSGKLTWSVTQPWAEPEDDKERAAKQKALDMIEKPKARNATKKNEQEANHD